MATDSSDESSLNGIPKETTPKNVNCDSVKSKTDRQRNRLKQKHREDSYNTFVVPEILCQCQQKCTERVTSSLIQKIAMYFFGLSGDREKQKGYLASLILGKEKYVNVKTMKGKRIRKMSYRYFVPILTDEDLKDQSKENSLNSGTGLAKSKRTSGKAQLHPLFIEKNWDHVEVCLKAFTAVHTISEKKVIVTRTVCELNSTIRCSRPFQKDNLNISQIKQDPITNNGLNKTETGNSENAACSSNIGAETAAWLTKHSEKNTTNFRVNPKTFLPEGLILPDSMICVPIFSDNTYVPNDPERDANIVDNFFFNQLWKPEYIAKFGPNKIDDQKM